jgi:HlyD family secretion protein
MERCTHCDTSVRAEKRQKFLRIAMMGTMARWLVGVVVVAAFGAMLWLATRSPPLIVEGEVSADRVDVSSRVAGRIVVLRADVGDTVESGSVLTEMDSPQLVALQLAARANLAVAKADLDRINSTRPETIAVRKAELESAEADETLSQATYNRQVELLRTGNARKPASMRRSATSRWLPAGANLRRLR